MFNQEKNKKMPAEANTTGELRKIYAQALLQKLLKQEQSSFTMCNSKGVWYVCFSCKKQQIKAQSKNLAKAVIELAVKNGLTFNTQSL